MDFHNAIWVLLRRNLYAFTISSTEVSYAYTSVQVISLTLVLGYLVFNESLTVAKDLVFH